MYADQPHYLESANVASLPPEGPPNLESTVSARARRSGQWTVIVLEGELDMQVMPLLPEFFDADAAHVVVDLHAVTFMDAAGLGAIMGVRQKAIEANGCLRLVAPSRRVLRFLMLTGTDGAFRTFASLDEALRAPLLAELNPMT